ncbi:Hsp33 family molecular chaperone HslO [Heliobacterium gestii]|uniref:33 kDa chaperonin n=1 Tax=Heliomicrobium gestii TaxID=2699 RepID=A0A845LJG4_HELGE|nr:Hsp33 family molecular chaperone HslO [Heliomicrobium gestii]MBM7867022.1 molecular chaperone Hsp33 [Heliomicrobium gestii]MZP43563.1 Hsp33 family molecular chaperone HslO [Heliomicrobium gestii]
MGVTTKGDELIRATAQEGMVRLICARTTELAGRARELHGTWPVPTAALGRALTAAALLGALQKNDEKMTLRILGDGPLGAVVAQGDAKGRVRGYVQHPELELPPTAEGKLDVGGAVGRQGHIHVTRDMGLKEAYTGSAELVSGEIAEDLTRYFLISEQTPSAVALGVLVDVDGSVMSAGGFMLQLMPGADDTMIDQLEARIARIGPISQYWSTGKNACDLMEDLLEGMEPKVLASYQPEYFCGCDRERVAVLLKSLGADELADMRETQGGAEVCCHFCSQAHYFGPDELQAWEQELRCKAE